MNNAPQGILRLDAPQNDLAAHIKALDGYWKIQSIFILRKLNLPVLNGVVVLRKEDLEAAIDLVRRMGWENVLLRHDRNPEVPSYPMGGYIVGLAELRDEARRYFEARRILSFLEPYDAFDNSYNVNALFKDDDNIVLEVLGHGFDASDLQRGHISPHEILLVDRNALPLASELQLGLHLRQQFRVDEATYRDSVRQRYLKIFRRLRELGKIEAPEDISDGRAIDAAKKYLHHAKYDLLSEHEVAYTPIPRNLLFEILNHLSGLPDRLTEYANRGLPFVVSSSYVGRGERLIFWDIVWPKLKYALTAPDTR